MRQARGSAGGEGVEKKNRTWLSGGFCPLPNQFIPVHRLSLLSAAARPGRRRDTDAHAARRRLRSPSDFAPSTSNRPAPSSPPRSHWMPLIPFYPGARPPRCSLGIDQPPSSLTLMPWQSRLRLPFISHPAHVWPRLQYRRPLEELLFLFNQINPQIVNL